MGSRLNDAFPLDLFQKFGARLSMRSMRMVGPIMVQLISFRLLHSGQITVEPSAFLHHSLLFFYVLHFYSSHWFLKNQIVSLLKTDVNYAEIRRVSNLEADFQQVSLVQFSEIFIVLL